MPKGFEKFFKEANKENKKTKKDESKETETIEPEKSAFAYLKIFLKIKSLYVIPCQKLIISIILLILLVGTIMNTHSLLNIH